jgi:hypothetical protein
VVIDSSDDAAASTTATGTRGAAPARAQLSSLWESEAGLGASVVHGDAPRVFRLHPVGSVRLVDTCVPSVTPPTPEVRAGGWTQRGMCLGKCGG